MRASILVHVWIIGLLALSCGGAAKSVPPPQQTAASDVARQGEILWGAILAGFEAHGIVVALRHDESRVVVSAWEELNSELRRRYVSRVISSNRGLMFRVIAEFERRDRTGAAPVWVPADDPLTTKRARKEEAELGAAIQAAFESRRTN